MFTFKNGRSYSIWKKQCIQKAEDMTKEQREEKLAQLQVEFQEYGNRCMELMWEVIKETDHDKKQALDDEFYGMGDLFMMASHFIDAIAEVNRAEEMKAAKALSNITTGDLPL
jgi:hypothetical protein